MSLRGRDLLEAIFEGEDPPLTKKVIKSGGGENMSSQVGGRWVGGLDNLKVYYFILVKLLYLIFLVTCKYNRFFFFFDNL